MSDKNARCLLVSDFTVGGLVPFLKAADDPLTLACTVAPFGQVDRVLLDGNDGCWHPAPDLAVVWTRPQLVSPTFARLLEFERVDSAEILADVDRFAARLHAAAGRVPTLFVPTWTLPAYDRGLGLLNLSPGSGPAFHLMRMNARLIEAVADLPNVYPLDAGRWVSQAGPDASSPKLWYIGKIAFGPAVFRRAADDIRAGVRAVRGRARKLLVLDLDDTLWGGIVGDVGWENLTLGGHHPVGEAFAAFQRALKALTNRGIVLGLVSKNTESVALEAIDRHPEMVLHRGDFAGWRINWRDKVQNLIDLVSEVNVGLDATVFVDDNPVERARVRGALPDVLVPEWPADKLLYEQALRGLTCFDTPAVSDEDRNRARTYAAERDRKALRESVQSVESYLASLGLAVVCDRLAPETLTRATQLLNKTNQMNLATRRMKETELREWDRAGSNRVYTFRVSDRFDDYGLTGLAGLSCEGDTARLTDFILSCRVMGRGVEQAMLHAVVEHARSFGIARLTATLRPTSRNAPCRSFFEEQSGFERQAGGLDFAWDMQQPYPAPGHIEVRRPVA